MAEDSSIPPQSSRTTNRPDDRSSDPAATSFDSRLGLLAAAGRIGTQPGTAEAMLEHLALLIASDFAAWCLIDCFTLNEVPRRLAVACRSPDSAGSVDAFRTTSPLVFVGALTQMAAAPRPRLIAADDSSAWEASAGSPASVELLRSAGVTAAYCSPMTARGLLVGAVTFLRGAGDPPFLAGDRALADDLALRAALLAEIGRLDVDAQEVGQARAAERARLQQILDVLPEGIALVDVRGQIIMSNMAARELWGRQAQGPPIETVPAMWRLSGQAYPEGDTPLERSIRAGEEVRGEQLLIEDGATDRRIPILINCAPLQNTSGTIIGAVAVFQDISPIKELERQKDEFLTTISHDLKNPLTTIKSLSQLGRRFALKVEGAPGQRLVEKLELIDQTASRATGMLNEFVDVTRLQMGRPLSLNEVPTDLVRLVNRLVPEHQSATDQHRIAVSTTQAAIVGFWDEVRLGRVIDNLISNAIKYSPNGGEVAIALSTESDVAGVWAVLRVRDHGVGIAADECPFIFERFFRGSNVGRISGSGIGLSGTRQIVEQHGGTIGVASEPGSGSTFTVRLPLIPGWDGD